MASVIRELSGQLAIIRTYPANESISLLLNPDRVVITLMKNGFSNFIIVALHSKRGVAEGII
jgi:hypothetical protein